MSGFVPDFAGAGTTGKVPDPGTADGEHYLNDEGNFTVPAGTGAGSVTSVDVAGIAGIISTSGGPVTTSGVIDLALDTQTAHHAFIGPASGSPADPTFRAIVSSDLPTFAGPGNPGIVPDPVTSDGDHYLNDAGGFTVPSGTGSGVSSITGTAHEIIASASTGAVTLSTPQGIDTTSSPAFASVAYGGLTGATAASRHVGANASGAPTTGAHLLGDVAYGQNGTTWHCTVAGTPGTWVQEPGTGGSGVTSITGTAHQVIASASTGAVTLSTPQDIDTTDQVTFAAVVLGGVTGSIAGARHVGATSSGHPTTGTHSVGDVSYGNDGVTWHCTVAGTPGTWVQEPGTGVGSGVTAVTASAPLTSSGGSTPNLALTTPLAENYGGTGLDTSGVTDGQLLIGATSGHTWARANLTQGANVTITNTAHGIEIAASGSGGGSLSVTDGTTTVTGVTSLDVVGATANGAVVSGTTPNATLTLETVNTTTKGDLQGYDTAPNRIPVGSNNQVLTADSTQSLGVKWATPSGITGISVNPITAPILNVVETSPTSSTRELTFTFGNEAANTVFAGPASGGAVTPNFRALVAADVPTFTGPGAPGIVPDPITASGRLLGDGGTWVAQIATATVEHALSDSTHTQIEFTSSDIPTNLRHLRFTCLLRSDVTSGATAIGVAVNFNGDTTNGHYNWSQTLWNPGSTVPTAAGNSSTNDIGICLLPASADANEFTRIIVDVPYYRDTNSYKTLAATASGVGEGLTGVGDGATQTVGTWRQTGAITDVVFSIVSNHFLTGSKIQMFATN